VKSALSPSKTAALEKFCSIGRLIMSVGVVQRSYSTRPSGEGMEKDISTRTWVFCFRASRMGSASSLKSRNAGMDTSFPDPSSAMMGSSISHAFPSASSWQSGWPHRHVSSAIRTAAAPARWAFRALLTKVQSPRSTSRMKGDSHALIFPPADSSTGRSG
jgi:hypothetical protein